MRSNTKLTAVVLAALVVAGLAAVGGVPAAAQSDAPPDEQTPEEEPRTITVSASGSAEATPDQALLEVAVVATGDSASAVRQQLADNVSEMRAALAEANLSDDQIRTARYFIGEEFEERPDGEQPTERRYRGVHAFQITLDDTERVGEIIDVAVENGATDVTDVRLGLSEATQRDLRNEALEDAMGNARGQAETLASAGNLTVTDVRSVSTVDVGGPVQFEAAGVAADEAGTVIEPGPVTVTATVQVTYDATRA